MELDSAGSMRTSTGHYVAFPQHPSETEAAAVFWNLQASGTVTGFVEVGEDEGRDAEVQTAAPRKEDTADT
eukprot:10469263-Prorocentrum_lima.AAC.1